MTKKEKRNLSYLTIRCKRINTQTDIATTRMNPPNGQISEKYRLCFACNTPWDKLQDTIGILGIFQMVCALYEACLFKDEILKNNFYKPV